MVITIWILLILNSLAGILSFVNTFIKPTTKERVMNGIQFLINSATIWVLLSNLHII